MKGKHAKNTANKQKLAKRMLALCFAVVFLCSCVLPVFASGSSLLTDALREAVEETAASTDTSTEAAGGTMMDSFQTMVSSYTTDKTTYRFWLSEKDSYDLPGAATTSASDLEGFDGFYAVVAIEDNTTLTAPEGFQNPADPTGAGRTFEGWYYIDTDNVTETFTFDDSPVLLDKSATIDVFAQWGEAPADDPADDADKAEGSTEGAATAKPSKAPAKTEEDDTELDLDNVEASYEMDGDDSDIALLSIAPSGEPQKTVSVGGQASLTSNYSGSYWSNYTQYYYANHQWKSNDTSIAKVTGNNGNAVVEGVKAGTVTITHTCDVGYYSYNYFIKTGTKTDTVKIQVTGKYDSEAYFLYCYTLIPGKTTSSTGNADTIWNGMGVGSISGLGAPNTYNTNTVLDNGYGSSGATITYPNEYPDITADGKTYKYASDDSPNRFLEGYYTIQWFRVVRDGGANAGNNGYNPIVNSGYPTYHLDGQITLNQKDIYTVDFKLKDAKSSTFELVDAPTYSKRVSKGTAASTLKVPTTNDATNYPQTKKVGNTEYEFDGWYLDEDCTTKVDFNTYVIKANTTFYGRYVPSNNVFPDDPCITVEKRFKGLPEAKLPADFRIEVAGQYLFGRSADKSTDPLTGDIIYRWKVEGVNEGTYEVKEVNEGVKGYDVTTTGTGQNVTIQGATFAVQPEGDVITSCANKDFKVGIEGDYNFIFVSAETSNTGKNVIISKEPLSLSQRKAVVDALSSLTGEGKTFAQYATEGRNSFYSIKENPSVVIDRTDITYTGSSDGGTIHISNTKQWKKAVQLKYDYVNAGSIAEVKVVNTYTSNQADLTVTKTVTGNMADLEEKFTFQMTIQKDSVPVDPEDMEWSQGNETGGLDQLHVTTDPAGVYTFTLGNNESIVFSGIPKDAVVTVTEVGENLTDYETGVVIQATNSGAESADSGDSKDNANRKGTVTINATAKTIAFTNEKEIPVNTGVILDTLPYVLMLIAVGGGVVAFFLRKRHHDDEE